MTRRLWVPMRLPLLARMSRRLQGPSFYGDGWKRYCDRLYSPQEVYDYEVHGIEPRGLTETEWLSLMSWTTQTRLGDHEGEVLT